MSLHHNIFIQSILEIVHLFFLILSLLIQIVFFEVPMILILQALEIYEGALGNEHHLVAKELDALAVLYQKQSK